MTNIYAKSLFLEHGFTITDTADGSAWFKSVTGANGTFYALVTDDEGNLPDYENIFATIYRDEKNVAIGDSEAIWADDSLEYAEDCLAELIPSLAYYAGEAL